MKKGIDCIGVTNVFFCHDGKGRVLCALRSDQCRDEHGTWDPGGGGIDFGERVDDALARELKEEYDVEPLHVEFLGFRDVHREINGVKTHWVAFDYKILIDPNRVKNLEPHKHVGLQWFTREEILDGRPLHSQFPVFLEKYGDALWKI